MKKTQKLISILLTAALLLCLPCVSALAEGSEADDEVYVALYSGSFGYLGTPGTYELFVPHAKGSCFEPGIVPTPHNDYYVFDGWYTGLQGKGDHFTDETVISEDVNVYANWRPNPAAIPEMETDKAYPMDVSDSGIMFSFTPAETAIYEVYTSGNNSEDGMPNIRILNDRLVSIAESKSMDRDYNAIASTELTAGTTYYIEFGSVYGYAISFSGALKRSELVSVTFHANPPEAGQAYFNGDPSVTEATVDVRKGAHLESYSGSGLTIANGANLLLDGWSLDPNAEDHDAEIIAETPIDLYAVYVAYKSAILDANGGCFSLLGDDTVQYRYTYFAGQLFDAPYLPEKDDDTVAFAGWATTPDAGEPDVFEGGYYEDLGETLYAVYAEPITAVFDANGGYLNSNPELTTLRLTYGKGHSFYPVHIEHTSPNMEFAGWRDQHEGHLRRISLHGGHAAYGDMDKEPDRRRQRRLLPLRRESDGDSAADPRFRTVQQSVGHRRRGRAHQLRRYAVSRRLRDDARRGRARYR